eukprot:SAG31_NODE_4575_length_3124_cov_2.054545_5_plen_76_part_00
MCKCTRETQLVRGLAAQSSAELWACCMICVPARTIGVAVEPMSSETNAFNNADGIVVLEAGASWQGEFHIRVTAG